MKKINICFYIFFLSFVVLFLSCSRNNIDNPEISLQELGAHIEYLSDDSLMGRYPGTNGDVTAANYIADRFDDFDLKSMGSQYLHDFEIVTSIKASDLNSFIYNGDTAILKTEFTPLSFSENTSLSAFVCFVGYGFNIDAEEILWNDYHGLDVKGKWVLMLRGEPEIDSLTSPYMKYSADRDKVMLAKDMGASGVLLVSGISFSPKDDLDEPSIMTGSTGLPVFQISRVLANKILSVCNLTIENLEEKLNDTRKPMSFDIDLKVKAYSDMVYEKTKTYNVLGYIKGNDPVYKDQYIIIGAHYDHLGMGGIGSSSRKQDTIAVHHGADDNASGVAAMIELSEKFAAHKKDIKRSILFVAFGAEEMGLLGSKQFIEDSILNPKNIMAMLNLDMIGRLSSDSNLEIGGVGTAKEFKTLLDTFSINTSFKLALTNEGYGPSDHASFYGVDVPVLHISTGAHLDYHTPEDTYDNLNMGGLKNISDFVFDLAFEINTMDSMLTFMEAGPKTGNVTRKRLGVTLGIMPDFAGKIKNGLRADFVIEGKPAHHGGMKKGDIITAINGKTINNIYDYMYRLAQLKFGQTITVEVIRGNEKKVLIIQL